MFVGFATLYLRVSCIICVEIDIDPLLHSKKDKLGRIFTSSSWSSSSTWTISVCLLLSDVVIEADFPWSKADSEVHLYRRQAQSHHRWFPMRLSRAASTGRSCFCTSMVRLRLPANIWRCFVSFYMIVIAWYSMSSKWSRDKEIRRQKQSCTEATTALALWCEINVITCFVLGLLWIVSGLQHTRVTAMKVRHNFSARHNPLPAKPPWRQQIELTFLWRSLLFANCRIPLWRNEGHIDASIGIAFFFMATCAMHLSHPLLPLLDWRQHVQQPVGGTSGCIFLKDEGSWKEAT